MIHYGSNLLDLIVQDFYLFQLKLRCAMFILTVTALEDLTRQRFFYVFWMFAELHFSYRTWAAQNKAGLDQMTSRSLPT